ncbi:Glycosyl transferase, group 1 domain protein [Rhodopirellula maiorica SM1]|uniref:Glycosyl transferase, group 1 domain protein n=1 Tax=Rhodopirellula maiorica SM1 TaxID=1265738 RepID=M5RL19_9BACT|nr:Glycosyl transferase, group 1 domain protein [Rhodopirellula maiorica SM1]
MLEQLAAQNPHTEVIAVSPGAEKIPGVRNASAQITWSTRTRCRLRNHRGVRSVCGPSDIASTIAFQYARAALQAFASDQGAQTVVVAATMSVALLAQKMLPQACVVYWVQGMPRLGQESLASSAVNACHGIVAPSRAIYRDLFQLICRDRFTPPVWVIPNTIDQSQFKTESEATIQATRQRLGIGEQDIAVMHIGRAPEKGLKIIETALAVGEFDRRVVLVSAGGPTPNRRHINQHTEVLETGRVAPQELNQIYQACSIGVVPSVWWENCPVALIEMMSLGLCPIGSRVGGIPEMIEHGESGLLVDSPNDAQAWASALHTVISDAALRQRLATAAKSSMQTRFSASRSIEQWCQVLNTVPLSNRML